MATTFRSKKNSPYGQSTLNTAISSSVLTIVLATGEGANFPSTNFTVSIDDEIILIDSRSADTLTVNASGRGYDSSTAAAHSAGVDVENLQIVKDFTDLETAVNALENKFPATTVDNAIARHDGTSGALQNYTSGTPTISDTGAVALSNTLTVTTATAPAIQSVNGSSAASQGVRAQTLGPSNTGNPYFEFRRSGDSTTWNIWRTAASGSQNVDHLCMGYAAPGGSAGFDLDVSGNGILAGDLAINGGDLTSSQTTFNALNSGVTTLNVGGAADVNIGGSAKTVAVAGALTVGGNSTLGNATADSTNARGVFRTQDITSFTDADATPDVNTATIFKTPATVAGNYNITALDNGATGQRITIIGVDPGSANRATLVDGSNLKLAGNWVGNPDASIMLVYDGTNWFETGRAAA
jgi:hypothetical protein